VSGKMSSSGVPGFRPRNPVDHFIGVKNYLRAHSTAFRISSLATLFFLNLRETSLASPSNRSFRGFCCAFLIMMESLLLTTKRLSSFFNLMLHYPPFLSAVSYYCLNALLYCIKALCIKINCIYNYRWRSAYERHGHCRQPAQGRQHRTAG